MLYCNNELNNHCPIFLQLGGDYFFEMHSVLKILEKTIKI